MHIITTTASTDQYLHEILKLQKINLPKALSEEEIKQEGFVTVDHNFDILKRMNSPYPHIIALYDEQVIGYALVMLKDLGDEIPILKPMFKKINELQHNGKALSQSKYFVVGQACVTKAFRAQGVFYEMYDHMKSVMQSDFDYAITEVSTLNPRSLKAHTNQGFENILSFKAPDGHPWEILLWDLNDQSS